MKHDLSKREAEYNRAWLEQHKDAAIITVDTASGLPYSATYFNMLGAVDVDGRAQIVRLANILRERAELPTEDGE